MELVTTYSQNAEKPPEEWSRTGFSLEIPMRPWDRIRPKHCAKCHRWFIRGGKKQIQGDMKKTALDIGFICDRC